MDYSGKLRSPGIPVTVWKSGIVNADSCSYVSEILTSDECAGCRGPPFPFPQIRSLAQNVVEPVPLE